MLISTRAVRRDGDTRRTLRFPEGLSDACSLSYSMESKARYVVLLLTTLAAVITYLDRVCTSVTASAMSQELGLNDMQMGYVFSIFGCVATLGAVGW